MLAAAFLCTALGALGVYLGAPQQRLWTAWAGAWMRAGGTLVLAAGCALWMRTLAPAAGFFAALTLTMALWVALPYLDAWRQVRRTTGAVDGR